MSVGVVDITLSKATGSNVALLQLGKRVRFRDNIQPVCVDAGNSGSFPIGTRCWVAGWDGGSRGKEFTRLLCLFLM